MHPAKIGDQRARSPENLHRQSAHQEVRRCSPRGSHPIDIKGATMNANAKTNPLVYQRSHHR